MWIMIIIYVVENEFSNSQVRKGVQSDSFASSIVKTDISGRNFTIENFLSSWKSRQIQILDHIDKSISEEILFLKWRNVWLF